jgi:hypothetical protein
MKTVNTGSGKRVRKCSKGKLHWLKHNACTGVIPRQKSHRKMNRHLNSEGQELKTGHTKLESTNRKGRVKEGIKEGEYG